MPNLFTNQMCHLCWLGIFFRTRPIHVHSVPFLGLSSDRDLSLSTVVPRRPSTTTTTSGPPTYPPSSPGAAEGGVDVTPSAGGATPVSVGRVTRGTPYVGVIQVKGQRNQCCDNVIHLLLIKHTRESLENYLSICCINYLVFLHHKCIWKNIKLVR